MRVISVVFNGGIGKEAQMSRRDLLLVAGTAAISSLLTYLTFATMTTPPEVRRHESSAANENHAAALARPDVTVSVKADKELVAATDPQQRPSRPDGENVSDREAARNEALAFQKRQELGERFSSYFNSGANPDSAAISARIENRFHLEEWNEEWAGRKENSIHSLFEANEDLSGITPLQVTCRSKNCQVVLSASSQDQVRLLSKKFMQAATSSDLGMQDKVVSFFPDMSMGRVVFYVSENGNMDLLN